MSCGLYRQIITQWLASYCLKIYCIYIIYKFDHMQDTWNQDNLMFIIKHQPCININNFLFPIPSLFIILIVSLKKNIYIHVCVCIRIKKKKQHKSKTQFHSQFFYFTFSSTRLNFSGVIRQKQNECFFLKKKKFLFHCRENQFLST